MPLRLRTSIVVAFALLVLYLVISRNDAPFRNAENPVDVLKGDLGSIGNGGIEAVAPPPPPAAPAAPAAPAQPQPPFVAPPLPPAIPAASSEPAPTFPPLPTVTSPPEEGYKDDGHLGGDGTSAAAEETAAVKLQKEFIKEYDALGLQNTAGAIYGSNLNRLVDSGGHAGFAAAALTPTESWREHGLAPPYTYNPYPEYNSVVWKAGNQGNYVQCNGPDGKIEDVVVFSGHPEALTEPMIGSYIALDIDSNLCFERETRLSVYGWKDEDENAASDGNGTKPLQPRTVWEKVDWGKLQDECLTKNADRYASKAAVGSFASEGEAEKKPAAKTAPPTAFDAGHLRKRQDITDEEEARKQGMHGMPKIKLTAKARTAVLLRAESGKEYSESDKQNIRSLITELSLRSGGEYQVFLVVEIKENLPIWTDKSPYEKAVHKNVPPEFWGITVLWNANAIIDFYSKIPNVMQNSHEMQWLSVQKFAQDYPKFENYWNWDLDTRYTGHHYNIFEKISAFAKAQPRKGLWERNERFYIPAVHGPYSTKFRQTVEKVSGLDTVWEAPINASVTPVGPKPISALKDDNYSWGIDEEADYISLSPIFNPVNTTWFSKDDVWGYSGAEYTPRRAGVGITGRCSKKLLDTMHAENLKGNFLGNEMSPQTVALLHGLKAVYAPVPMYFDRAWEGKKLELYFNPGIKGESGSTELSPFSSGSETRFDGSTWGYRAVPPGRLWNQWLGWEDGGIGGVEWEKTHGRTCLPPVLLHPVKDVVKPPPGQSPMSKDTYRKESQT